MLGSKRQITYCFVRSVLYVLLVDKQFATAFKAIFNLIT